MSRFGMAKFGAGQIWFIFSFFTGDIVSATVWRRHHYFRKLLWIFPSLPGHLIWIRFHRNRFLPFIYEVNQKVKRDVSRNDKGTRSKESDARPETEAHKCNTPKLFKSKCMHSRRAIWPASKNFRVQFDRKFFHCLFEKPKFLNAAMIYLKFLLSCLASNDFRLASVLRNPSQAFDNKLLVVVYRLY